MSWSFTILLGMHLCLWALVILNEKETKQQIQDLKNALDKKMDKP